MADSQNSGALLVSIDKDGIRGLKEFRAALRQMHGEWPRALSAIHKQVADKGAAWAQAEARGMGGIQAKAAGAIKGKAGQRDARIGVSGGRSIPMANPAFWGAKKRTGWNAGNQTPNLPPWVGNDWATAVRGQGPYAINNALADNLPELEDLYWDELTDLARAAFPE